MSPDASIWRESTRANAFPGCDRKFIYVVSIYVDCVCDIYACLGGALGQPGQLTIRAAAAILAFQFRMSDLADIRIVDSVPGDSCPN